MLRKRKESKAKRNISGPWKYTFNEESFGRYSHSDQRSAPRSRASTECSLKRRGRGGDKGSQRSSAETEAPTGCCLLQAYVRLVAEVSFARNHMKVSVAS